MAGYARIQKWCLYLGLIGFAIMVVLMLDLDRRPTSRRPSTAPSRSCSASPAPTTRPSPMPRSTTAGHRALAPLGHGRQPRRHHARHARDDPVHAVLDPVPELGLDALRRGPRLGRLPQGPARHARRDLGHRRSWPSSSCCWPRRPSAGTSSPPPTSTSSTTSTATRRPPRRSRSGATRRCSPPTSIDNSIFQIGMVVLFGVWFLGWSGTLFLSSTRMIFAAAFDRVLPDHAAQVSERSGGPGDRAALHHGPVDRGQRHLRVFRGLPGPDPGRDTGHRRDLPRQRDRRDDPALVQAARSSTTRRWPTSRWSSAAPA